MDRKKFIKNGLLATGCVMLPNALWSLEPKSGYKTNGLSKVISERNLKRFKVSEYGTKFFETQLIIQKSFTELKLQRKYFISENLNGFCTPTLLDTSQHQSLIFIPELYKEKKQNGFIVNVCENGVCEETKIFTHENQGFYAFWGKEYLGNPALYHYNLETFHLMRIHQENGQWINHRVMPIWPNEMIELFKKQLQQVEQRQLIQQFGCDFEIRQDGFYKFLSLKNDWEQSIITKEKEAFEKDNPAKIFTSLNKVMPLIEKDIIFNYTNPFIPIYCSGDNLSLIVKKPSIIYTEVAESKILIPNMPAYETQDDLGECRAFSVRTIMQKYTCDKWKSDIPDCSNPPEDLNISSFGMLIYTNSFNQEKTFQPLQEKIRNMNDILLDISRNPLFILSSCKPFSNMVNNFSFKGKLGLDNRDRFFNYLKNLYKEKKNSQESDLGDCSEYLTEIAMMSGINKEFINLRKALTQENYDKFLYTLFFDGCKLEGFADGFRPASYPNDKTNATPSDIKNKIIEGLKKGKPVLFSSLCMVVDLNNICTEGHSIVISGFKKVSDAKSKLKDVFKVHNSWGVDWQISHNDGWVDADILAGFAMREPNQEPSSRIISGAVAWLEP